jgi:hypothetical protein
MNGVASAPRAPLGRRRMNAIHVAADERALVNQRMEILHRAGFLPRELRARRSCASTAAAFHGHRTID